MDEADYWQALEFRVCRELARMRENHLRFLWCDGFIPEQYFLESSSPRITGRTWICNGQKQEEWSFTLLLNDASRSVEEIQWQHLLPRQNVTGWLAISLRDKRVQIGTGEVA